MLTPDFLSLTTGQMAKGIAVTSVIDAQSVALQQVYRNNESINVMQSSP